MRLRFQIQFSTEWGQQIQVLGAHPLLGAWQDDQAISMEYLQDGQWELTVDIPSSDVEGLEYQYVLRQADGNVERSFAKPLVVPQGASEYQEIHLNDSWRSAWDPSNAFFRSAFSRVLMNREESSELEPIGKAGKRILFQLRSANIPPEFQVALVGNHPKLGNWDAQKGIVLSDSRFPDFLADVRLSGSQKWIEYKYVLLDRNGKVVEWEHGENRRLELNPFRKRKVLTIQHDEGFRGDHLKWRGTGVAIPVFSLRSKKSWGIGEFTDIPLMVDWAVKTKMDLVQILPINDTTAHFDYLDSYPYSGISVYALHPIYLNPEQMGKLKDKALLKELKAEAGKLNELPQVDYEAVIALKWRYFRALYEEQKEKFFKKRKVQAFLKEQGHWLKPYAVFCALRDKYQSANFAEWPEYAEFDPAAVETWTSPKSPDFDEVGIHMFLQFHLHTQLLEASDYARKKHVVLKGDIPIGIYRQSVDAWMYPHLFHMDAQAGAPPDAFAVDGQNWGFPTYNWEEMAKDGYLWWRQRMSQMSAYFDAYRIDHILGFFRIWEIPGNQLSGLLGHFYPSLAFHRDELAQWGLWMDEERYCRPYIRAHMLHVLGEYRDRAVDLFLHDRGHGTFELKSQVADQQSLETFCESWVKDHPADQAMIDHVKPHIYGWINEVLFLKVSGPDDAQRYHPRVAMHFTQSYRDLPNDVKHSLNELYTHFFYKRHNEFWRDQAMVKLPAIRDAADMLVCGEDLGMVPDSVPGVMAELGILSLEIQRMPKDSSRTFFHPIDAPYLSVVSTSTHDMSTVRGWWEEDRELTRRFYHEMLGQHGEPPMFCEPWIVEAMVNQHLESPAMWAILPLQDFVGIDGELRYDQPTFEQINVPANPKHYWRYRFHMNLEDLIEAESFNAHLADLVKRSGRG
ncbi:4-alpha-glucanotransferase [Pontibacter sp. G13]|uniref:4-alpha-glucanotransferase n=1 Tax=Pontibacter sp. G13 TaxID=3074898 RepID=UPI00288BE1E6|nr:4-alpha-glucanotransferase [Pontibacter sp. G13]WNJ19345.1 4-alpha-glucanotransferase [Pontibacter sp. G13]